ncbi:MAG: lipocalin family protein [Marinicaulis sp.]|nr:lipocalin family protein [Marinicaulis sp.]NNL89508.1 lipocalin family protein [Marinicaulis sp.]
MKGTLGAMRVFSILVFFLVGACSTPPINRDARIPLTTERSVDLGRYQGLWYEIARFPNSFEENCEGVTAEYAKRDDGLISVTNTCRNGAVDGKVKVANGKARVVDEATNAKLEVSFFGPFWGDYWILWLADDYSLSLVGEPQGRYLWMLSRTPEISDEVRTDAIARLKALGYNTDALYYTKQPPAGNL